MASVFYDAKSCHVPKGQTMKGAYHAALLRQLRNVIKTTSDGKLRTKPRKSNSAQFRHGHGYNPRLGL